MTKNVLLDRLKDFTEAATKGVICPVRLQKGDTEQTYRAAAVYKMRLPDGTQATKKAPFILHQVITGRDIQPEGEPCEGSAVVRSVFAVYHDDEQEGALLLLELMETLRVALLKQVVIGAQFELDLQAGLEMLTYPENTAPYFAGEIVSTWKLPAVKREVHELWQS